MEWKRLDERDTGNVDAEVLLNGMLDKTRLLDIVENFIGSGHRYRARC